MAELTTKQAPDVSTQASIVASVIEEAGKVIVGQRYLVDRMMIGLLTGGHLLIEGVPGLAKTLSVKTLASICDAEFSRVQFTPDLLPSDLTGTLIFNPTSKTFDVKKGPVFTNFVLADEINRAPSKVQSALLEAMQEHQVTIGDTTYPLPAPFMVLATQNPIEQEGTYPLPEAQMDRFIMKLQVDYPTPEEERQILDRMAFSEQPTPQVKLTIPQLQSVRQVVKSVYVDEKIKRYVIDIITATRRPESVNLPDLASKIEFGGSPRATIHLVQAAQALAFLNGRGYVTPDDIKGVGIDVLRHRIMLSFEAEAEGVTVNDVIQTIFDEIEVP